MVTIDPDKSISDITGAKKVQQQDKTDNNEFSAVFRQAAGNQRPETSQQLEPASSVSGIRPVQFENKVMPATNAIVDHVQQLLDTMEAYQQKLTESSATLKTIQPLVDKIAFQSETLAAKAKEAVGVDDLQTIVDQSLTLSSLEIARFRSGQYIDR
jgi:hypothetical protein